MAIPDDAASIHAALDGLMMDLHRHAPSRPLAGDALGVVWRAAAGEYVGRHSRPVALARGLLRVVVGSASLRDELLNLETDLVARLNRTGRLQVTALQIDVIPQFDRTQRRRPNPGGESSIRASTTEEARAGNSMPEVLPAVREELRPTIERLWTLHRLHQRRRG